MPVNEILAPCYVLVKYSTDAHPEGHVFRLYFDVIPSEESDGSWLFSTYFDTAHPLGWTLHDIVKEVVSRGTVTAAFSSRTTTEVEVWKSTAGVNTFLGIDSSDYSDVQGGAGVGVASAYTMCVFKASNKSQFRLTQFEGNTASPQRIPKASPPEADNGSLEWFFIRSVIGFVTNDNLPIVSMPTVNTGYNRKLSRSYGRRVFP